MKPTLNNIIHSIETEMIGMWTSGDVKHVMKEDPEFITMIMTALMFDKDHFRAMGLEIGEA